MATYGDDENNLGSTSDEEAPPLHFYLTQSKDAPGKETKEPAPPPTMDHSQPLRPTPAPLSNMLEDPNLNYHIPQFQLSGNFGEPGHDVPPEGAFKEGRKKKRGLIRDEEGDDIEGTVSGSLQQHRKYRDMGFGVVFWVCFIVMIILGIIIHAQGSAKNPVEEDLPVYAYYTLVQSTGLMALLATIGIVCGAAMIIFFRFFIKLVVWVTVCFPALALFAAAVWAFASAGTPRPESNAGMITLGVLCLVFSLGLVLFIFLMKRKIDTTVAFLKLSCTVLQAHSSIFLASVVNSALFLVLTLLWYWNFSWVYVMGHEEPSDSETVWVLNPSSYVVSTFLIFVYLWTAAVLNYIQTYVISEVTCHWYYHRNDPSAAFQSPVMTAYRHAYTTSFGSICFASLVYSFLRLAQILIRQATRLLPNKQTTLTNCCIGILESLARLVDSVNKFALAYCALSGAGFCHATKMTFGIFRRNLLDRIAIATLSHFIMSLWVVSLSLIFALSAYTYAVHTLMSVYGWLSGILTFLVSYYILRFYADIILNISDTLFLCYAIDCDSNSTLLGVQSTPNQVVHRTMESIFHQNQNAVVYDIDEGEEL